MADVGMILDLAHLAEEGAVEALDNFPGPILVSHTSPLALVPSAEEPERHITDLVIRRTADREGVIGLLLGNRFLKDGWEPSQGREIVTLADVATGIDYICQMLGDAAHVGIGSDFDGGFGLDKVPQGLDSVADLRLIGESLDARGYNQEDIEAILGGNWLRFLRRALPEN
jgi:membrane dipeptidase